MKYNAAKIAECVAWVEKNGLHPQPCGAMVKEFCEAMGISFETYSKWCKKTEFAEALTRAREVFRVQTVREVENSLARAARGAEYSIVTEERHRDKDGNLVTTKATRKTFHEAPNVEAAKFLLTNMAGEDWRLKQEQTIKAEAPVFVVRTEAERKKLEDIAEGQ